ncbi:MAG TPA: LamG domain-containing protein [Kofleriaceae bacterium]|nr:LamG domain-containing protein [Kofleriaceae bacterium]
MVRPPPGRLVAPILLSALLGCSQSLFDEHVDDDGTGADDGGDIVGDDSSGDDGGDIVGDDGADDGGSDGGVACPAPCQGDPVTDFTLDQGGANGRWFYLVDRGDSDGAGFDQMVAGTYQGADAWVVDNDAAPAIVSCAAGASADVCAGIDHSLVLVPAAEGITAPVLAFVPPAKGSYRLVGNFKLPQGFEEGRQRELLVSRNARADTQFAPSFLTSADPTDFSVDIEALAGDQLLVSLPAADAGDGSPIAFDFGVTLLGGEGEIFPGKCMFAATFSADDALADQCGGASIANLNDDVPDSLTVEGPSLSETYGDARVFADGQYMHSTGSPLDYRADFTVQFWANALTPQSLDSAFVGDWDVDASGGMLWFLDDTAPDVTVCYFYDKGRPWTQDDITPCLGGMSPRDDQWHFYRVSRKADAGTISLCIDGVHQNTLTEQGNRDMTSDLAPYLGRNPFGPPGYGGSIDDLRIFKRALPCAAAP